MQTKKLTPKKVALAIGVSESSMKRWCDRGIIDFQTTAGGHRRLARTSVIDFLRQSKYSLDKSELIGLPAGIRPDERDAETARQDFLDSILAGNEEEARRIIYELFLSGLTVADIGDRIISPSFNEIGAKWECGSLEVYQERRACEISLRVLSELRTLLPTSHDNAPLALGGAPGSDGYTIPNMLVEMVFREAGWRSQSLGCMLPFPTLATAALEQNPRLFWLSVSAISDETEFLREFELFRSSLPTDTFLAVGGRALKESLRQKMRYSAFGDNLKQIESLANTLKTPMVTKLNVETSAPATVSNY